MNLSQAKDELAKGVRIYKAFEHGVEVLAMLERSENTLKDHTQLVASLKKEAEALKVENSAAKEHLLLVVSEAEILTKEASENCKAVLHEAKEAASQIVLKAEKYIAEQLGKTSLVNHGLLEAVRGCDLKKAELASLENKIEVAKKAMTQALKGL